jgi:hypothetical protein
MDEQKMVRMLAAYADELQRIFVMNNGDLRAVSQWSFAARTDDPIIPYMSIDTTEKGGKVVMISASPVKSQKDLVEFFGIIAPGKVSLRKYTLRGGPDGIHFMRRDANTVVEVFS